MLASIWHHEEPLLPVSFDRSLFTLDPATLLSSSVVAALVAALVSLRTNERKIHIENVTQERAKWRSAIRSLADDLIKSTRAGDKQAIERYCSQLALNVNPFDGEDRALVRAAEQLANTDNKESQVKEVTDRLSLLLKHDWERAKREARPWFFRGKIPRRVPYCEFRDASSPAQTATHSQSQRLTLLVSFAGLTFSAGIIFFLAVGLTEPFQHLVRVFNDPTIDKPLFAWAQFLCWSTFCGSLWSSAYLWFKASEKKFLEAWFAK